MIVSTIIVAAYIGFSVLSSGITSEVSSGTQYDELATLKSNYSDLEAKFNITKPDIFAGSDKAKEKQYINAELELLRAGSAIGDVESALKAGKSASDVDARIKIAKEKLTIASQAYNAL
ncbi:hypothetical protein [Methanobrevibacter sp. TMH8]|uniref:hypothetical protein n=1 Tax=Methanobrevibacter sp. TMH8 TaxID=2848611 RepID=UPI001CD03531|nr:hypothetical protein [Methanobrevibacter sp. TMH8]